MKGKWEQFFSQRLRDSIRSHFRGKIVFELTKNIIKAMQELLEIEGGDVESLPIDFPVRQDQFEE